MGSYDDLRHVLTHIDDLAGKPDAWKDGLDPQLIRDVNGWLKSDTGAWGADYTDPQTKQTYLNRHRSNSGSTPQVPDEALNTIRGKHPELFNPQTKAPVTPSPSDTTTPKPPSQQQPPARDQREPVLTDEQNKGHTAEAVQKLENKLKNRTDRSTEADRLLAEALLNAHETTQTGAQRLNKIQKEIENAVNTSTVLDTPMGVRELHNFLNSKLQDIRDVVHTASFDAETQKNMLSALSGFYTNPTSTTGADTPRNGTTTTGGGSGNGLGLGGLGLGGGEGLGGGLLGEGGPLAQGIGAASGLIPALSQIPQTLPGAVAGIPGALLGGSGLGTARTGRDLGELFGTGAEHSDDHDKDKNKDKDKEDALGALFNDPLLNPPANGTNQNPPPSVVPNLTGPNATVTGLTNPSSGPTAVTVTDANGATMTVTADNPQLAAVINDVANGTSPEQAYRNHGMATAPPANAPTTLFDTNRLRPGSYGTYSSGDLVVALGPHRVLLDGHAQPIAAAMKTGFLGWHEPPAATTSTGAPAATPQPPAAAVNTAAPNLPAASSPATNPTTH